MFGRGSAESGSGAVPPAAKRRNHSKNRAFCYASFTPNPQVRRDIVNKLKAAKMKF